MESSSSSDDSFLWINASNDSIDSQNATVETMAMHCEESETGAINDHEKSKKSKKRKASESAQDCSNFIQPERKKIKLEPESDIEVSKKKKKAGKHVNEDNESPESILESENYLNLRVKQEQISVLTSEETPKKKKKSKSLLPDIDKSSVFKESHVNEMESNLEVRIKEEQASLLVPGDKNKKKKKHKKSDSLIDTGHEPESAETDKIDAASYLNMKVKQEQASPIEPEIPKSKKKKKHRNSLVPSDTDITSESMSEMKFKDTLNSHNDLDDQSNIEYSVIEEKFSAEETVVEEQRKKKNKKDKVKNNHELEDTEQEDITQTVENNSYNDTSLPAINFTCNNIASSTFINNSSVDIMEKQNQKSGDIKHKNVSRALKISDRIMFEEDENSSNLEILSQKSSGKVSSFLEANPQLKLYKTKSQGDCSITEDDEIWILRWPHEIDIKKLSNTNLTLEGKCKVKINGQTYDGFQNKDVNRITLVKYQNGQACVSNVPVEGCMDYRKRIHKVHIPDANNMVNNQTNFIPLPDTKCRHPLFGAHYKKAMKIPTAVADRLKAAKEQVTEAPCYSTKKKKHKKDKKNNIKIEIDSKGECEPSKKKRKRKHSEDNDAAPKKTKRIKHDPDSAVVWESEKAIEENLFNF